MRQRPLERTPARLLFAMVLLAISIIPLLPFHTAHAAPRRPLTGCSNNNIYLFGTAFSDGYGNHTVFDDWQYYTCGPGTSLQDSTWFEVVEGTIPSIRAQADTWITQSFPGGARYGETGRSSLINYPNDGKQYYIQTAFTQALPDPPQWGCNWINLPNLYYSHDYTCGDMQ
jgi:hypothetical protein